MTLAVIGKHSPDILTMELKPWKL